MNNDQFTIRNSFFLMPRETILTAALARLARLPFLFAARQPVTPPRKALILKPCCVSQAMLTTPLLAALCEAYPQARFDWAISDWARPVVVGNPRLTEIISTGPGGVDGMSWRDVREVVQTIRAEEYDTCFIPSRSSMLSLMAWMAGIPQRVGLHVSGRGFADTLAVSPPSGNTNEAVVYLSLATAVGVDADTVTSVGMEFYPPDADRTAVTRRLVDEVDWLGDKPLVILHPGGGQNPVRTDERKQWPLERFVLLGNHLVRRHGAQILLVG
ncbi:MAG: glycosyltransferase family 9 protein, partial [Anaerolineae bacterium]